MNKLNIKFWIVFDVESKCLYNEFSYFSKDLTRSKDASLRTDVMMKLLTTLFKQGLNVTCNSCFISLNLSSRLQKQQFGLAGTIQSY